MKTQTAKPRKLNEYKAIADLSELKRIEEIIEAVVKHLSLGIQGNGMPKSWLDLTSYGLPIYINTMFSDLEVECFLSLRNQLKRIEADEEQTLRRGSKPNIKKIKAIENGLKKVIQDLSITVGIALEIKDKRYKNLKAALDLLQEADSKLFKDHARVVHSFGYFEGVSGLLFKVNSDGFTRSSSHNKLRSNLACLLAVVYLDLIKNPLTEDEIETLRASLRKEASKNRQRGKVSPFKVESNLKFECNSIDPLEVKISKKNRPVR